MMATRDPKLGLILCNPGGDAHPGSEGRQYSGSLLTSQGLVSVFALKPFQWVSLLRQKNRFVETTQALEFKDRLLILTLPVTIQH